MFRPIFPLLLATAFISLPLRADLLNPVPESRCGKTLSLPSRVEMQAEIDDYLRLAEEALSMRARTIALYHELEAKKAKGPLSGQDLRRINEGAVALIEQRAALFEVALAHECWVAAPPVDDGERGDILRAGALMSLSAALILYDNYLSAISLYRDNADLRQHLNKADQGFALGAGELRKADRIYDSTAVRHRVRRAVRWYLRYGKTSSGFEGYDYLDQSIAQSPSLNLLRRKRPLLVLGRAFEAFGDYTVDSLVNLTDQGSYFTSLFFGNTVGLVETRKGKLFGQPKIAQQVQASLEAGDILLEKTPFRLTDSFIPGHWGHAAVWIGTEAELVEMGLWDHPVVRPHQDAIRAGRGIVEALRSGVEMNDVPHFMNIDDLAILRRTNQAEDARREVVLQSLRQVGKEYDFNFDAETTDRVFCSKLVYFAYGDIDWPTSRMLGRYTVSPDDIARRSIEGGPLSIALLYHDGERVSAPLPAMEGFLAPPPSLSFQGAVSNPAKTVR